MVQIKTKAISCMNWKQMFNKKNKIIRIIQKYNVKKYSGKSQASSISGLKELYKKIWKTEFKFIQNDGRCFISDPGYRKRLRSMKQSWQGTKRSEPRNSWQEKRSTGMRVYSGSHGDTSTALWVFAGSCGEMFNLSRENCWRNSLTSSSTISSFSSIFFDKTWGKMLWNIECV